MPTLSRRACFQIGQNPKVVFNLTQQNATADQKLQNGDTFILTFNVSGGMLPSVDANPIVKSATLTAVDFVVELALEQNRVVIRYIGPGSPSPAGDSISVKGTVFVTEIASGGVHLQLPPERYTIYTIPNPISSIDFPVGPGGPVGPMGTQFHR